MNAASRFIDAKVARQGALFFLSFTTLVLDISLNEAKAGAHDLIVMGVSRRPGERLYFGDTPTAVLAK